MGQSKSVSVHFLLLSILFPLSCPNLGAAWKFPDNLPGLYRKPSMKKFEVDYRRTLYEYDQDGLSHDGWPDHEDERMFERAREVERRRREGIKKEREEKNEKEVEKGKEGAGKGEGRSRERKEKVALMFLVRDSIPHDLVWKKWLKGHNRLFSVYIHHSTPGFQYNSSTTNAPVFYGRGIPSIEVRWGTLSILQAERRLLAAALANPLNQRFVLLSERCVPLWPAKYTYKYLMEGNKSFVGSYETTFRWTESFFPEIPKNKWRKGSQWFAIIRDHALMVINDDVVYNVLLTRYKDSILDESYIQTLLPMLDGDRIEIRPVTYVKWTLLFRCHPKTFSVDEITVDTFQRIRNMSYAMSEGLQTHWSEEVLCKLNGQPRHCYLFARKFSEYDTQKILEVANNLNF